MSEEQISKNKTKKFAVVLVRGVIGVTKDIRDTLFILRLRKKHVCVVIDGTPSNLGFLQKVKDYTTYGEISDGTIKELSSKRGKKGHDGKLKPFFELAPPKGGFERQGIKKSFRQGGVLGYRGEKINDLIKRML